MIKGKLISLPFILRRKEFSYQMPYYLKLKIFAFCRYSTCLTGFL